jgi:hypothetical protein
MARKRKKDPAVVGADVASRPGPVAVVWTLDRVKSRCEVADDCWVWHRQIRAGQNAHGGNRQALGKRAEVGA